HPYCKVPLTSPPLLSSSPYTARNVRVQHHKAIFPGFIIPLGSKVFLIRRITSTPYPCSSAISDPNLTPTPCAYSIDPPISCTKCSSSSTVSSKVSCALFVPSSWIPKGMEKSSG